MPLAVVESRNVLLGVVVTTLLSAWVECLYLVLAGGPPKIEFWYLLDYMLTVVGFFVFQFVVLFAPTCLLDEECCCCNCCGWCCRSCLGHYLHRVSDEALTASLPAFLLLAAFFPISCAQLYLTQFALLSMLVILHRDSTALREWRGVAVDGVLLSLLIRGAAGSENSLFWNWRYGWLLCLPTLALHAVVVRGVENETRLDPVSSIEEAVEDEEKGRTHIGAPPDEAEVKAARGAEEAVAEPVDDLTEYSDHQTPPASVDTTVAPSESSVSVPMELLDGKGQAEGLVNGETTVTSAEEEATLGQGSWECVWSAVYVSSALIVTLGVGASPGLLVRGSGVDPGSASYTWPLLFPVAAHVSVQATCLLGPACVLPGPQKIQRMVLHLGQILFMVLFLFLPEGNGRLACGGMYLGLLQCSLYAALERLSAGDITQRRRRLRWLSACVLLQVVLLFMAWFSFLTVGTTKLHLLCLAMGMAASDFMAGPIATEGHRLSGEPPTGQRSVQGLVCFVVVAGGLLLASGLANAVPSRGGRAIPGKEFVVSTWNVQRGFRASGWGTNMDDIAARLRDTGLGVVATQESEALSPLLGGRDWVHVVGKAAEYHTYYGMNPLVSSFDGAAILSPYRLRDCTGHQMMSGGIFPSFDFSQCIVDLSPSRSIVVINAHPTLTPKEYKREHIAYVLSRALAANATGLPVIIMGDFNTPPNDADMAALLAAFPHSFSNRSKYVVKEAKADGMPAYTRDLSKSYVDYILYSPSTLRELSSAILADTDDLSDHKVVTARFAFVD